MNVDAPPIRIAPEPFPVEMSAALGVNYLKEADLENELVIQKARLERLEQQLRSFISALHELNVAILKQQTLEIHDLFRLIDNKFGISLFVIKKALSVKHSEFIHDVNIINSTEIYRHFFTPRRNIIAHLFEDSVDPEHSYIEVRRKVIQFSSQRQFAAATTPIMLDLFSPEHSMASNPSATLQAYSRWSAIDSFEYLMRLENHYRRRREYEWTERIQQALPQDARKDWCAAFGDVDLKRLLASIGGEPLLQEYRFLSHTPAWTEFPTIAEYRDKVEHSIGKRLDGEFLSNQRVLNELVKPSTTITGLMPAGAIKTTLAKIDPRRSGAFHRTLALVASIEGGLEKLDLDGEQLAKLLHGTVDVAFLFSVEELLELLPAGRGDDLFDYLRTALLYDAEESRLSNHAFRKAAQNIVRKQFDGSVVRFAEYLDELAPHVADHFVVSCNEYFLTELYSLYETTEDVVEAYASLHEWYGKTRSSEASIDRARTYRLNLVLQKVRGDIDDARIFVDPVIFQKWGIENAAARLRDLAAVVDEIRSDPAKINENVDPIKRIESPKFRLLTVLDACYSEFCKNKFFGVDSFIGRRIRHGTLHGHLVAELAADVDELVARFRYTAPAVSDFFRNWYDALDRDVRALGNNELHVRSAEKSGGLINPTIAGADRGLLTQKMFDKVVESLDTSKQIAPVLALIYEYNWLFLEVDLLRCRKHIEALRQRHVLEASGPLRSSSPDIERSINSAMRSLNSDLQTRFDQVSGWLSRPESATPSATIELLFQAVLSELSGRFEGFSPKLVSEGETSLNLLGFTFYHFYDALFVMVGNAAEHGHRQGILKLKVTRTQTETNLHRVKIAVTSELRSDKEEYCRMRIREEMDAEIGDALIQASDSGIRKARALVQHVEEFEAFSPEFDNGKVTFSLSALLPFTG